MRKMIPLTQVGFSNNISKWLFLLMGVSNCSQGIERLVTIQNTQGKVGFAIFMIATGILMMIPTFVLFFPSSSLAPKCIIDEKAISIKEDVHKRWKTINWTEIKQLTYKSFVIEFLLNNNQEEYFHLRTNAETSIEIKKAIREIANQKSIPIIG